MDSTLVQNGLARIGYKLFEDFNADGVFVKSYEGCGTRNIMRFLRASGFVIQVRDKLVALYRGEEGDLVITTFVGDGKIVVCHTNGQIPDEPELSKMQAQKKSIWRPVIRGVVLGLLIVLALFLFAAGPRKAAALSMEQAQTANMNALAQYKDRKYRSARKVREAPAEVKPKELSQEPAVELTEPKALAAKPVWGDAETLRAVGNALIRAEERSFPDEIPAYIPPPEPPRAQPPVVLGDKPKWSGWIFGSLGVMLLGFTTYQMLRGSHDIQN